MLVDPPQDPESVGRCIREAASQMRGGIPHEHDPRFNSKLARSFKAKTYKQFQRDTDLVQVDSRDGVINVMAWMEAPDGRGWVPLEPEYNVDLPDSASDADLGQAVLDACDASSAVKPGLDPTAR